MITLIYKAKLRNLKIPLNLIWYFLLSFAYLFPILNFILKLKFFNFFLKKNRVIIIEEKIGSILIVIKSITNQRKKRNKIKNF